MIKKQIGFQVDKLTYGVSDKATPPAQLRADVQAMQTNGWEVLSCVPAGYDSQYGDIILVITMVKYEWVPEPVEAVTPPAKAVRVTTKKDA